MSDKTNNTTQRISPLIVLIVANCVWYSIFFLTQKYIASVLTVPYVYLLWYMRRTIWGWWSLLILILMSIATILYRK